MFRAPVDDFINADPSTIQIVLFVLPTMRMIAFRVLAVSCYACVMHYGYDGMDCTRGDGYGGCLVMSSRNAMRSEKAIHARRVEGCS